MKKLLKLKARLALPLVLLGFSVAAVAQAPRGTSQNSPPGMTSAAKNIVQNGRAAFRGNLRTGQHIYYEGDNLDISVQFTRGGALLVQNEADAHIVIFSFDGSVMSVPIDANIGSASRRFFRINDIDTDTLPEGQYQLGLVLTVPGGDPTLVEDWYSGFRGLLDTEAVFISAKALRGDRDKDGEWDDDSDDDGIAGEEDDERDTRQTSLPGLSINMRR